MVETSTITRAQELHKRLETIYFNRDGQLQWCLIITMSVIAKYCILLFKICILALTKQYKICTGYIDCLDISIHLLYPHSIVITRVYCIPITGSVIEMANGADQGTIVIETNMFYCVV